MYIFISLCLILQKNFFCSEENNYFKNIKYLYFSSLISTLTYVFLKYPIPPKRQLWEEACQLRYG